MKLTTYSLLLLICALFAAINVSAAASGLPNGKACTASTQCATSYCHHGYCDDKKPDNHVCYKDAGCISGMCVDKKCQPKPPTDLPNGEACTASTQCHSQSCQYSKCAEKLDDGKACYKDNMCTSGHCISTDNKPSVCTTPAPPPKLDNGAACTMSTQCKSESCQYSKCAAKLENGKPCYKANMCVGGACEKDNNGNGPFCTDATTPPTTT